VSTDLPVNNDEGDEMALFEKAVEKFEKVWSTSLPTSCVL